MEFCPCTGAIRVAIKVHTEAAPRNGDASGAARGMRGGYQILYLLRGLRDRKHDNPLQS